MGPPRAPGRARCEYDLMTELPQQNSAAETMDGLLEEVLREFAELDADADPLRVELVASEILGEWWEAGDDLAIELIEFAATAPEPERHPLEPGGSAAPLMAAFAPVRARPERRSSLSRRGRAGGPALAGAPFRKNPGAARCRMRGE